MMKNDSAKWHGAVMLALIVLSTDGCAAMPDLSAPMSQSATNATGAQIAPAVVDHGAMVPPAPIDPQPLPAPAASVTPATATVSADVASPSPAEGAALDASAHSRDPARASRSVDHEADTDAIPDAPSQAGRDSTFVANDASIDVLLNAVSGRLSKPVVASAKVRRKRVTGEFDLRHPYPLLRQLSSRMSLLWYSDGSSIYVYDNSEIKNAVVSMEHATVRGLRSFIHETRLYDSRFPIRGEDFGGTFYVTGAPIYVNLVTAAARYLDQLHTSQELDKQVVKVVRLQNSFVDDRAYTLRDKDVTIPGLATVLAQIYGGGARGKVLTSSAAGGGAQVVPSVDQSGANVANGATGAPPFSLTGVLPQPAQQPNAANAGAAQGKGGGTIPVADGVRVVAYSDTNSLVLVGPLDKVLDMESLIHSLDVAKRQIELSLWIIDIKKTCLDQLGVNWQGQFGMANLSVGFNQTSGSNFTTLNGVQFLASVTALAQKGDATVVSRPVVLTQENVPATFDSNQTFYAKLIGERSVQLDHVTYGTLVSVLPRLSEDASEVEMMVDVEDGNTDDTSTDSSKQTTDGTLPLVNRTEINTVARVPREMSLLIGGNTRDDTNRQEYRIPGLAAIPLVGGLFRGHTEKREQVVRVFLIQPRLLAPRATWQDGQDWQSGNVGENQTLRATVDLLRPYMEKH